MTTTTTRGRARALFAAVLMLLTTLVAIAGAERASAIEGAGQPVHLAASSPDAIPVGHDTPLRMVVEASDGRIDTGVTATLLHDGDVVEGALGPVVVEDGNARLDVVRELRIGAYRLELTGDAATWSAPLRVARRGITVHPPIVTPETQVLRVRGLATAIGRDAHVELFGPFGDAVPFDHVATPEGLELHPVLTEDGPHRVLVATADGTYKDEFDVVMDGVRIRPEHVAVSSEPTVLHGTVAGARLDTRTTEVVVTHVDGSVAGDVLRDLEVLSPTSFRVVLEPGLEPAYYDLQVRTPDRDLSGSLDIVAPHLRLAPELLFTTHAVPAELDVLVPGGMLSDGTASAWIEPIPEAFFGPEGPEHDPRADEDAPTPPRERPGPDEDGTVGGSSDGSPDPTADGDHADPAQPGADGPSDAAQPVAIEAFTDRHGIVTLTEIPEPGHHRLVVESGDAFVDGVLRVRPPHLAIGPDFFFQTQQPDALHVVVRGDDLPDGDLAVEVHGPDGRIDGVVGTPEQISPEAFELPLLQPLPPGEFKLVLLGAPELAGKFFVEIPFLHVHPFGFGQDELPLLELELEGVELTTDLPALRLLPPHGVAVPDGALGQAVATSRSEIQVQLEQQLPPGPWHIELVEGDLVQAQGSFDVFAPHAFVDPPHVRPSTPELAVHAFGFDLTDPDLELVHRGPDGIVEGAFGDGHIRDDGSDFPPLILPVVAPLEAGPHTLKLSAGDQQLRVSFFVSRPELFLDPPVIGELAPLPQRLQIFGDVDLSGARVVGIDGRDGPVAASAIGASGSDDDGTFGFDLVERLAEGEFKVRVQLGDGSILGARLEVFRPFLWASPGVVHTADVTPETELEVFVGPLSPEGPGDVEAFLVDGSGEPVDGAVSATQVCSSADCSAPVTVTLAAGLTHGRYRLGLRLEGGRVLFTPFQVVAPRVELFPLYTPTAGAVAEGFFAGFDVRDEEITDLTARVLTPGGAPVAGTRVSVDVAEDGSLRFPVEVELAPGPHRVRFTRGDGSAGLDTELFVHGPALFLRPQRLLVGHPTPRVIDGALEGIQSATGTLSLALFDGDVEVENAFEDVAVHDVFDKGLGFQADLVVALPVGEYRVVATHGEQLFRAPLVVGAPVQTDRGRIGTESGAVQVDESTGDVQVEVPNGNATDIVIERVILCPDGSVPTSVTLVFDGATYEMELDAAGETGLFVGTVPADAITAATEGGDVRVIIECPGEDDLDEPVITIVLFDPSGIITDARSGLPIVGATVTLHFVPEWRPQVSPEDTGGTTCQSNASRSGSTWDQVAPTSDGIEADTGIGTHAFDPIRNPQTTNAEGRYGWDVSEGCWYVTVVAQGYAPLVSPVVGVGPAPVGEVTDLDLSLTPLATPPSVDRRSGDGRHDTAADISRGVFAPGVDVAYVSNAFNYPDALAGGPLAARDGGPVLLVNTTSIPDATITELQRVEPKRIVVLGGENAVSAQVFAALDAYDTGGGVSRISGEDRFHTAAKVSQIAFPDGADRVYVAVGTNFADALAGGPLAARDGAPLLLVRKGAVPQHIADELTRLAPTEVFVLGGSAAVADTTVQAIAAITGVTPKRIMGADRYETALAIARRLPNSATAYVATGSNFPDALAGVAAAAVEGAPIILVRPSSVPAGVEGAFSQLGVANVRLLGGESAVSAEVSARIAALIGATG